MNTLDRSQLKHNRVMLISPPGKVYVYPDGSPAHRKHCSPPLGPAYLAASLLKFGYDVQAVDMLVEGYTHEVYEEPFIIYGLSNADTIARIRAYDPHVIGISILFSMVIKEVYQLCVELKAAFPDKKIVLGGHHPTGAAADVMSHPEIDFVMLGEADLSFVDLMDAINGLRPYDSVRGLCYRDGDEVINTLSNVKPVVEGAGWNYYKKGDDATPNDVDALPYPAWHLFPMEKYWEVSVRTGGGDAMRERYAVMLSTRGCPYACYFCSSPLTSGYRNYRKRTEEDVIDEIRWLVDEFGVEEVQFLDDNFYVNKKRVKRLLPMIAKEFPNVYFQVTAGTEINALDEEIIDLMAEANFNKTLLAIEAGDPELNNALIDKRVKIHRVPQVVDYLRKKNIETRAMFMMGFPGETRNQIQRTIDLARALAVDDFNLNIVTAMPGTPLYDECIEKGLFHDSHDLNNFRFSSSSFRLPDTTPEELENLRRTVWREEFEKRRQNRAARGHAKKYQFKTFEEYETFGFKIRPPARSRPEAPQAVNS